ncbi:MAG: hypothetical protein DME98_16845 [Verrucomicrobia bacterium]|nr:MAG: hypothetical protein DME98_16845 [Verrucomicrobiota bacterium]
MLPARTIPVFQKSPKLPQEGRRLHREIGRSYRALARERKGHYYWFWIGTHEDYNKFRLVISVRCSGRPTISVSIRVHLSRGSLGEGGFACLAVLSRRSFREDGSLARRWVSLRGYPKQKPRRTLPAGL